MNYLDIIILAVYMLMVLGVGLYFHRKHTSNDDYFVGGRSMGAGHIGLSVVATDVGGGFSIGLGGLGFTMGLSGSWMLFTGLVGAWLSAVLLIPRICRHPKFRTWLTLPQWFGSTFGKQAALCAAIISAVGYTAFTSSQLLAGAKLAHAALPAISQHQALFWMGGIAVIYTVMGGMKAVIYTDTVQWLILMLGLGGVALPLGWNLVGGWEGIQHSLEPEMWQLTNVPWHTMVYWVVTIIPIWFVGMTLFQRILACRDEKTARRAWMIAGLFEWPLMAFMGVGLGLLARVAAEQQIFTGLHPALDPEQGLPLLLVNMLPVGFMGFLMAAYFSAILSTADSCLMAASGNVVSDILDCYVPSSNGSVIRSQQVTLLIGCVAIGIAWQQSQVLDLMLHAYSFLVAGLLVPMLAGLFSKRPHQKAALAAMFLGGSCTIALQTFHLKLPLGVEPALLGMGLATLAYFFVQKLSPQSAHTS